MTFPDISLTSWAGIMAAAAVIGTCWRTIGTWAQRLCDVVIGRVILKDEAARAVLAHVWKHGTRNPLGLVCYGGLTAHVAPKQRVEVVPFEALISEPRLVWFGKTPVLVQCGLTGNTYNSLNVGVHVNSGAGAPVMLRFLRGTLNVDTFVTQAVEGYNALRQAQRGDNDDRRPKRFNVIRMQGPARGEGGMSGMNLKVDNSAPRTAGEGVPEETLSQLQRAELRLLAPLTAQDLIQRPPDGVKPFMQHPVAPEILDQLTEIGPWLKHERWFRDRGIPWYRGFLLHGPSGSGKSTIVRNVALQYDLPVYTFDLSSYDNRSFTDDWKQVLQNAPAIALLEDIDCTYNLRENLAVKGKQRDGLTFDCLLNTLSGVGSSDGVLLFVTTNHLETLDPALGVPDNGHGRSTRPGRINRAIYVGPIGEAERRKVASHILSDMPELVEATVVAGAGEMAAQFQERCAQLALAEWNAGKRPTEVPASTPAPVMVYPTVGAMEMIKRRATLRS